MSTPRRSFLGRLGALLALGATPASFAEAAERRRWPDERWLEALAQREHKMIIETGIISDGLAFRRGLNFLDVLNADYQVTDPHIGLAIGTHTAALAVVLNDAMWAKHGFGAKFAVKTAAGEPATTNPYQSGAPSSVASLQSRGVSVLACNRSLMRLARELAGAGGDAAATHKELVANVLPGVVVVPAMVVALSRAQGRGVPYMAVA